MSKARLGLWLPILCLAVFLPLSAKAFMMKSGQAINIPQEQTVAGNFFAAGSSIIVDGQVTGDVICVGQAIVINGEVGGDVICVGQSVTINGKVNGNVRTAGNTINLNNAVARNVMAFGANIIFGNNANIGWDALVGGAVVDIGGKINGNLHGGGAEINLRGQIAKDVVLQVEDCRSSRGADKVELAPACLTLADQAQIGGNLTYTAKGKLKMSENAKVGGEIKQQTPKISRESAGREAWSLAKLWTKIIFMFGALLIGLLLINLFKDKVKDLGQAMLKQPWVSLGWGLMVLFLTPIIFIILLITIIGLPLAFILLLSWLVFIILSKVIAAIIFGQWLLEKFKWQTKTLLWPMIIGVILASIIFNLPYVGWLLCLLAILWGLGGLWLIVRKWKM